MLHKEARDKYRDLSEGEKEKKQKKVQDRHKTLSEEEKRKTHQYHHD